MLLKKLIRVPVYLISSIIVELLLILTVWPLAISLWEWLDDMSWDSTYYASLRRAMSEPLYTKIKEDLNV